MRRRTMMMAFIVLAMNAEIQLVHAQIPCGYKITHVIEAPPCSFGNSLTPTTISPDGRYVCGFHGLCLSVNARAFLYDTDTKQLLSLPYPLGTASATAQDVNGQFVVGVADDLGFLYEIATGQFTLLSSQSPRGVCSVRAINASNSACGSRSLDDGGDPVNPLNAFIWSPTTGFLDLEIEAGIASETHHINDNGYACGRVGNNILTTAQAFLWHDGKVEILGPIPGGITSISTHVSEGGEVIGSGRILVNGAIETHSFVWKGGTFTMLPNLSETEIGVAQDRNPSGLIVGTCRDLVDAQTITPCLWWAGSVTDLNDLLIEPGKVFLRDRPAIADNGTIVVRGSLGNAFVGVVLAPVSANAGDTNCDQIVDVDDLLAVINNWGQCIGCPADLNADETVDSSDLMLVISHWTI
jgi:hypothetical protein